MKAIILNDGIMSFSNLMTMNLDVIICFYEFAKTNERESKAFEDVFYQHLNNSKEYELSKRSTIIQSCERS